ncbi:hypothetical protein [Sulfuricurvum sp.]|uniref:hypothetical protein n=1 Tax=Sulfuricurvum sp. TaxID=2025608 RepID=UPI003BB11F00
MLKNTLDYIPHIVLLRSDKVFHTLIQRLLKCKGDSFRENEFKPLIDGIRDFYPNTYRLDEIELSLRQEMIKDTKIDYSFDYLEPLFDRLLVIDGSKIYPKDEHLEEYIALITKISPYHLIGYKLAVLLRDEHIAMRDIYAFIEMATPLGFKVRKNTEYADNHLHLKGAGYSSFNLMRLMNRKTDKKYYSDTYLREQPRINEFSYLNNGTYSIGQVIDIAKLSIDVVYSTIVDHNDKNAVRKLQKIVSINREGFVHFDTSLSQLIKTNKVFNFFPRNIQGELLSLVTDLYKKRNYDKANLVESILLFYTFLTINNPNLRLYIKLYLQAINILRSYMVMSQNIGLAHFSEFSGADIRQADKRNGQNIASGIINSGTNYLHAKMGIQTKSKQIADSVEHIYHIFQTAKATNKEINFNYNFGLSTIKAREKKKKLFSLMEMMQVDFIDKRKSLRMEANGLDDFLRNAVYKNTDKFRLLLKHDPKKAFVEKCKLQGEKIDLSSLVIAIDAVGKETHTPPEVFAPFFRYLRAQPKSIRNAIALHNTVMHHPRLIITAHAGEDFNHIISGMRSVAECIEYFGMGKEDRIGHALSLGINPSDWFASQQVIFVTRGEYLDNLVWLSGILKEIKAENSYLTRYILKIQDLALAEFREIYGAHTESVSDMYCAWEYRKNCPLVYLDSVNKKHYDEYSKFVCDRMDNEVARDIYQRYHTCKRVRDKSKEVKKIEKQEIDKDVLEIYEMLQDYLIDKYAKAGIIFETNPSSNIFVSALSTYSKHPIFRFYPPKQSFMEKGAQFNKYGLRQGMASVTINSDDPAIFVTSIQNEYETLRRVAVEHFECTKKEADDWLDDIRRFGINVFKESYVGSC